MRDQAVSLQERPASVTTEMQQEVPNPYIYAEFAGWAGERYLKKVLRQIFPMALYRTWEIFIEYQARGNDCYLSVPQLATLAGRTLRTMQKDLATLGARQLLAERAVRKRCAGPDGTMRDRVVVVKDFSMLYTLAHEYHEWLQAADYIAPDRAVCALILPNAPLLAKVRRFNNYRRVLYTQRPGPQPQAQEEDRWFTDYQAEATSSSEQAQPITLGYGQNMSGKANKKVSTILLKEMSKDSPKRNNEVLSSEKARGERFDSASLSPENVGRRETKTSEVHKGKHHYQQQRDKYRYNMHFHETPDNVPSHPPSTSAGASIPSITKREQIAAHRQRRSQASDRVEKGMGQHVQTLHCQAVDMTYSSPGYVLAHSFVEEISLPFGDLNPKGSLTRVQTIIANTPLDDPADVLFCLVRAYTIARDTAKIRPEHWNPQTERANRMPLFCAMFQRLAQTHMQDHCWEDTWQQMEEEIRADPLLTHWQSEQQETWREIAARYASVHEDRLGTSGMLHIEQEDPEMLPSIGAVSSPQRPRTRKSQTPEEQEQRAAFARTILKRLSRMAVVLHEPIVWWEHLGCGCPLYHTRAGQAVCALCFPDPTWSEEVRALLHTIVEPRFSLEVIHESGQERSEKLFEEEMPASVCAERATDSWTEREDAYAWGVYVIEALAAIGYTAEITVRGIEERYQVLLRSEGYEIALETPQQVQLVLEQVSRAALEDPLLSSTSQTREGQVVHEKSE